MLGVATAWGFCGYLADYAFPFGQATDLFLSCFKGTVASKVNIMQQKLQKTDFAVQQDDKRQLQRLHKLESETWLYEGVLRRLGEDSSVNHGKIARTLEALEYKRNDISEELEPLKPLRYRVFSRLQDALASQAERDYEQLEKIISNLVLFADERQPSQLILSDTIRKLNNEILQSSAFISPYRLRLLYKIDELMNSISERLLSGSSDVEAGGNYRAQVNELRSRISILSRQFNDLLIERNDREDEIDKYKQNISSLNGNVSDLHRAISNTDADRAVLRQNLNSITKTAREKQNQVDALQSSIAELQNTLENSQDANQNVRNQLNQLQNRLKQSIQDKNYLSERIDDISQALRKKTIEVEDFQLSNSQIDTQNTELQNRNSLLYRHYQQQQNEIAALRKSLRELSSLNERLTAQALRANTARKVSTETTTNKAKISEAEYRSISNQSEYIRVRGYTKSNGTRVAPYYRRRGKR